MNDRLPPRRPGGLDEADTALRWSDWLIAAMVGAGVALFLWPW